MTTETERLQAENSSLKATIVRSRFENSAWVREHSKIPADLLYSRFGERFRLEEGRLIGYDDSGNQIMSRSNPGEPASFDDVIEALIGKHPERPAILKQHGASGGGASRNEGGVMARAAFEKMTPAERMKHIRSGGSIHD